MPTDIFPQIDIPVVAAVWTYTGLPPEEMEGRVTSQFERAATTTVTGIEHIESQSLAGVAVIKIFLQPGTSIDGAVAEVASIAETILKQLPPGATPPLVLRYSASERPSSSSGSQARRSNEQQIYDLATNFLRHRARHGPRGAAAASATAGRCARSSSTSIWRSSTRGGCRRTMSPPRS